MPWLTVITVVKDDVVGLRATLRSLEQQNLDGVEYLVIDSSVAPDEIVTALRRSNIKGQVLWTSPQGIFPAMNEGLRQATGDYVYFLNAGDELTSSHLLSRVRDLVLGAEPEWLIGPVEVINQAGDTVVTPEWDFIREKNAFFSRGAFPAHQGTFMKREALVSLGGLREDLTVAGDYAAALAMSRIAAPLIVGEPIARFHEGGTSTRYWNRMVLEFHRVRRQEFEPSGRAALTEYWATARQWMGLATHRSMWPISVALALGTALLLGLTGVEWNEAAALTLMVVFQALGGILWWRMLQPGRSVPILEALGMGLGLGTVGAMIAGLILTWWLAPVTIILAWILRTRVLRHPVAALAPFSRVDGLALISGIIPGIAALLFAIRSYPLNWTGLWTGFHGDMAFFEALSASDALLGPSSSIFLSDGDIRYHSLAYAWAGELTVAAEAAPFVTLTRLLPVITLVGVVAIGAAWARQVSRSTWVPVLAVLLIVTGGFVGATYGSVLNVDSPSQSMGVLWLLTLSVAFLMVLRDRRPIWGVLTIAVLVFALVGGKVSTAAIAATGMGLVTVMGLLRRETWRWCALTIALVSVLVSAVGYLWLLEGSANSGGLRLFTLLDRASSVQSLNPVVTPRGIIAGILLLLLAVLPRWAGLAWLFGSSRTRWDPVTVFGMGLAVGGLLPILVLSGGFNDLWFAAAASGPLAVISAVGTGQAARSIGSRRLVLGACTLGLVISGVVALIWTTGSSGILGQGWRWSGPFVCFVLAFIGAGLISRAAGKKPRGIVVALTVLILVISSLPSRLVYAAAEPLVVPEQKSTSSVLFAPIEQLITLRDPNASPGISEYQKAAGDWLRQRLGPSDVIATNLTASALVPALTRAQTFVSGMHMQTNYGSGRSLPDLQRREELSWEFISAPSDRSFIRLCDAGVTWLWISLTTTDTRSWEPFASVAWDSPDTALVLLNRSLCR